MKKPTFSHGVIVAAILAFSASALVAAVTPLLGVGAVLRLVIPALGLAYLLSLFSRNNQRLGRVATLTAWGLLAATSWWFAPPLPLYVLIHVTAVWLVRSFYCYSGFVPALMDFGITALSVSASTWAITRSSSVFLATWCFFLVQALFVFIPTSVQGKQRSQHAAATDNDNFERAHRQADRALQQLFTR